MLDFNSKNIQIYFNCVLGVTQETLYKGEVASGKIVLEDLTEMKIKKIVGN
jgi:hypothetical protein